MPSRTTLLEHVLAPGRADLSEDLSRYLLTLDFPAADHARYAELAEKAQNGDLSPEEAAELDDFLDVNDFLTIVQAKARASLHKHQSAA